MYNTWKFPGKFEKYVTVFTGPEEGEKQVITLVGHVDPVPMGVVTVEPRKISAGDLPLDRVTEKDLIIQNTGDAALSITKVVSKKFKTVYFDAEKAGGELTVPPGKSVTVKLGLKPQKAGRYLDFVMIHGEARNITEKGYKVVVIATAR